MQNFEAREGGRAGREGVSELQGTVTWEEGCGETGRIVVRSDFHCVLNTDVLIYPTKPTFIYTKAG